MNTMVLQDFPERDIGVSITGLLADIEEVLRMTEDTASAGCTPR
ncbi:hypothetical protein ACIQUM_37235 [Amycolatopsis azurea]